jgi:prepilin signal peptidase PulO-like enzyme (type II secretory pathway)
MRAACVFILHFPIAVELLARPACTGGPVVIGGAPEQRKAVLDCSPEAEAQGARPGRPLRQALGLGDVKLAGSAGLALGGPLILPALLITALAGGLVAAYLALRLRRRSHPMPYAPFIAGGALAVLLWQGSAFVSL